jgi:hypothetical protein
MRGKKTSGESETVLGLVRYFEEALRRRKFDKNDVHMPRGKKVFTSFVFIFVFILT